MLRDEKILITGPAGRIAYGLARSLVADNDVWGIARFGDPATREKVDALGVTTRAMDYSDGDLGDLPSDFTYLLHIAADFSVDDYDRALRVNAEGTGFVLEHCRKAKAALVMSTVTTYKPHPDPWHPFREDDPLGDAMAPPAATYSVSKIAEEGVARYCARSFDLPVTIARMGAAYSDQSGLPVWHLDAVAAGEPVMTRWDPMTYSPIHDDDICEQLEPLLDVAGVPATIVNWAGDEPVSVQEYSAFFGELLGVEADVVVDRDPRRVARLGRGPHEAYVDHGPVPGRLARRVPPRGRALLPGPRAECLTCPAATPTSRRSSPTRARSPAWTTSGPATSAKVSPSCSRATTATPG